MKCDLVRCARVEEVYFPALKIDIGKMREIRHIPLAETDSELEAASSRSAIDNILFAIVKEIQQEVWEKCNAQSLWGVRVGSFSYQAYLSTYLSTWVHTQILDPPSINRQLIIWHRLYHSSSHYDVWIASILIQERVHCVHLEHAGTAVWSAPCHDRSIWSGAPRFNCTIVEYI